MSLRFLLIITVFLTALPVSVAQTLIRGSIVDTRGEAVIGGAVTVDGLNGVGALADENGNYSLALPALCPESVTLIASALGYETQTRRVGTMQESEQHFVLSESSESLNTLVVTATRTPKLLKDVPIVTRVITASEIERVDAVHIGELLESELPGIEFSYSMNQQQSLNLQGFGGNSVLFLIDGERIAGETLDNIDYNRLSTDNIARVEIVKGAASSLYGSNAVGGVVNIISAMPTEPWSLRMGSRVSTMGERTANISAGVNNGKLANLLSASFVHSDAVKLPNPGEYSQIYGGYNYSVKDQITYKPIAGLKFTGKAGYYFRERNSSEAERDRYRDFSGSVKGEYEIGESDDITLSYNFDQYDKSNFITSDRLDVRDYSNVQHSLRALYSHDFTSGGHNLIVGGDFMRDYLLTYQISDGSRRQITADLFAQFDWNPTDWLNVIGGLRGDYFSDRAITHVSPKLGMMFKLAPVNLRASYAGGFRAPTLKEMYMNFNMANIFMIYGNPELQAEKSDNFSLSAEWNDRRHNVTLTGYYNFVENNITTAWNEALGGMVYTNVVPMQVCGADINVSGSYDSGFKFRLSYTWTKEIVPSGETLVSATRPHSATLKLSYGRNWRRYSFDAGLTGRFMSGVTSNVYTSLTDYTTTEEQYYPGYMMWKATLTQRLWRGIRLNIIIDNLLDYVPSYYYNNSPTTIGRSWSLGLSIDFYEIFNG